MLPRLSWIFCSHWELKKLKYEFKIKKDIAGTEGYNILAVTQSGIKIKDISSNEGQLSMDYSKYQLVNVDDYVMNHMDLLTGYVDCSQYVGVTSPDYRVFYLINKTSGTLSKTIKVSSQEAFAEAYLDQDEAIYLVSKDGKIWKVQ